MQILKGYFIAITFRLITTVWAGNRAMRRTLVRALTPAPNVSEVRRGSDRSARPSHA